jgi:glycosyltransferase involved in cell wall biosynthesis
MPQANCPEICFLFLGDGASKKMLQAKAEAMKLDNVIFVDTVSKSDVVRYWSLLDVSILHLKKTELFTTVIPSKLFECMAMGIPVLHGVMGESADIVGEDDIGIPFEPENAEALASALTELAKDDLLRSKFARNGGLAALKYDRSSLANRMLALLEQLAITPRKSLRKWAGN